jgi:predicted peptidase
VELATGGVSVSRVQVRYLLYLPREYGRDPMRKWPLILYLHGKGERGDDLELLKKHPLPKMLEHRDDFPFIVASPQLSAESVSWSGMIDALNALLDVLQASYAVDPRRVCCTGISMGGAGTWLFGLRSPMRFAALVPIAGYYYWGNRAVPINIRDIRDVPVWAFHGGSDTDVPSFQSEVLVEALRASGGDVRFTLYPDADHAGSWTRAYADARLYEWILSRYLR